MDTTEIIIEFYYREDCHLCEKMQQELNDFLARPDIRHVGGIIVAMKDIDDNATWFARFREYVPVLVLDDEEICYYYFDEESLMDALSS